MPVIRSLSLAAILLAASLACGGGGGGNGGVTQPPPPPPPPASPPSGSATVTLDASSFSPSQATITRNGTVTWSNTSGIVHNVTFTSSGSPENIDNHSSGSNQRAFATAGTFNYGCTLHAGMTGAVTVQ